MGIGMKEGLKIPLASIRVGVSENYNVMEHLLYQDGRQKPGIDEEKSSAHIMYNMLLYCQQRTMYLGIWYI